MSDEFLSAEELMANLDDSEDSSLFIMPFIPPLNHKIVTIPKDQFNRAEWEAKFPAGLLEQCKHQTLYNPDLQVGGDTYILMVPQ